MRAARLNLSSFVKIRSANLSVVRGAGEQLMRALRMAVSLAVRLLSGVSLKVTMSLQMAKRDWEAMGAPILIKKSRDSWRIF